MRPSTHNGNENLEDQDDNGNESNEPILLIASHVYDIQDHRHSSDAYKLSLRVSGASSLSVKATHRLQSLNRLCVLRCICAKEEYGKVVGWCSEGRDC